MTKATSYDIKLLMSPLPFNRHTDRVGLYAVSELDQLFNNPELGISVEGGKFMPDPESVTTDHLQGYIEYEQGIRHADAYVSYPSLLARGLARIRGSEPKGSIAFTITDNTDQK